MAYCNECGAYIPDGQTVCLACGHDPAQVKKKAEKSSGGFAYQFDSEVLKDEIEKQKQRIKEESRKWAEEEKARREAQKKQTKTTGAEKQSAGELSAGAIKIMSAASYLGALWILPFIFASNSDYAKFHAKQGIKLFAFGIMCKILTAIIPIAGIINLAQFYLIYKGMTAALNGKEQPLPFIGELW